MNTLRTGSWILRISKKLLLTSLMIFLSNCATVRANELPLDVKGITKKESSDTNKSTNKFKLLAGFSLTSPDSRFGGISSIQIQKDGNLLWAISDRGTWMKFLLSHRNGKLTEVRLESINALQMPDNEKWHQHNLDAEASAYINPRTLLISFERVNRLLAYKFTERGIEGFPRLYPRPKGLALAPRTGGPEAMTRLCDGRFFILSEKTDSNETNHVGWVGSKKKWQMFKYRPRKGYNPTGATTLPDCRILLTIRRFNFTSFSWGFALLHPSNINSSKILKDSESSIFFDPNISENFEAIAARRGGDGDTYVYVMADDNFSIFQSTLLLQFKLESNFTNH